MKNKLQKKSAVRRRVTAALATTGILAGALVWSAINDSASAAAAGDGTSSSTAGASCWGIKKKFPTSADGVYWLQTPQLGAPAQFRCDMTTEGGGWVLVGRGRDGWLFNPSGQGTPTQVRDVHDGVAAFRPATLPTETIDGLLGGVALNQLPDGVRLRRANSLDGSVREEWRFKFADRTTWTWGLGAGWKLNATGLNGTEVPGGNSADTAQNFNGNVAAAYLGRTDVRIAVQPTYWYMNKLGFLGGTAVPGTAAADAYVYNPDNRGGRGFTQVWIRPKIENATWPAIPAAGLNAYTRPAGLNNRPEDLAWGVTGLDRTGEERVEPYTTPVADIETAYGRAFVGGRFAEVRKGASGTPIPQRFLAAFDQKTGEFIPGFAPNLDGRVWDIVDAGNNRIIIGGDFTSVNGVAGVSGLAMLDATTGQLVSTWKAVVGREDATGRRAIVRALDIHGGYLYAAGNFNRYTGGTWNKIGVGRAVKVNLTNGNPDGTWRPNFPGSPVDLDASASGDRVYLTGFFKAVNGDTTKKFVGIVNQTNGALVPGLNQWTGEQRYGDRYQQTVTEVGDKVVIGGAEHILQMYNRSNMSPVEGAVAMRGGDFQESTELNGVLYVSCHCADYFWRGSRTYGAIPAPWTEAHRINYVAALNPNNMVQDERFVPDMTGTGDGVFALEGDSAGCLWMGGQLTAIGGRWAGGFAKVCPNDTTPPSPPTGLVAVTAGEAVNLKWNRSISDPDATYWLYRDDRPIAQVYSNSYVDSGVTGSHVYWVVAVDSAGNRSNSTIGVSVGGAAASPLALLPFGSNWTWAADNGAIPPNWKTAGFSGQVGPAELGWGDGDEATVIDNAPMTHYFQTQVQIPTDPGLKALKVNLKRDDGAVVYLDGLEVMRSNIAPGPVDATTRAAGYVWGTDEKAVYSRIVPLAAGIAVGTHRISAELHQQGAGNGDATFDLSVEPITASTDATAPPSPALELGSTEGGLAVLRWAAVTDPSGMGGYMVAGPSGSQLVGPMELTATLALTPNAPTSFTIRSYDAVGNMSAPTTLTVAPTGPVEFVAGRSPWSWSYPATDPAANWAQPAFDATPWAVGPGEFGYGDGDESTVISTAAAPRPVTAYFRKMITIDRPTDFKKFVVEMTRDDGAAVYVNGVEVKRDQLPTGPLTASTPATVTLDTRTAETTPLKFELPPTAFAAGSNTIAVEVHNANRWSGDLSFDLKLTGER